MARAIAPVAASGRTCWASWTRQRLTISRAPPYVTHKKYVSFRERSRDGAPKMEHPRSCRAMKPSLTRHLAESLRSRHSHHSVQCCANRNLRDRGGYILRGHGLDEHRSHAWLIDSPTPVEGEDGLEDWLAVFRYDLTGGAERKMFAQKLRPTHYKHGVWTLG